MYAAVLSGPSMVQGLRAASRSNAPWTCPVHEYWLRPTIASVSYGYTIFRPGYLEAARFSFPHTGVLHGGCIPGMRFGVAWYCPACRAAKRDWAAAHPGDGWRPG
jgi:hypothetical protein